MVKIHWDNKFVNEIKTRAEPLSKKKYCKINKTNQNEKCNVDLNGIDVLNSSEN